MNTPIYTLFYQGKDYTTDIAPMVESLDYEESLEGRAGSLSLYLNNADKRWIKGWMPQVADRIGLYLGYNNSPLLDCGTFWVDEIEAAGSRSGERFTIKAMSNVPVALHSPMMTKVLKGSFDSFARSVAKELGMSVEGDLSGTLLGMAKGNGLGVLMDEAKRLGKVMKTEGNKIIFYPLDKIKKDNYRVAIDRKDTTYRIIDRAAGRYTFCEVRHWDAKKKVQVRGSYDVGVKGGGKATIWREVKSTQEATDQAKRWVEDRNKQGVQITLTTLGNVKLLSGIGATLAGFGNYDGTYYIAESTHSLSRSKGYTTTIMLKR